MFGLAASAFYWVGMVSEMSWLNHASDQFSSGRYGYDQSFFPLYFHVPATESKLAVILADSVIVLSLSFVLTAIIYFIYRKNNRETSEKQKNIYQTVLPLGLFAFFMTTPLSRPLWQFFTPLQKVQLPMRWTAIVAMCGAVVAAASVHYLLKGKFLKKRAWSYGCLIFISTVAIYNFVYFFSPTSFAPISREKFENTLSELPQQQSFVCWWAIWSKPDALKISEKIVVDNRQTQIISWEDEQRVFEISAGKPTTVRVATFYYPLWQATVNGKLVEIGKDENGAILIPIGSEESRVELYFQESSAVKLASMLSLLTWLLILATFLVLLQKNIFNFRKTKSSMF